MEHEVFRINQSYPGNSGSYNPYINPILEILDRTIHTQSYPGNIGSDDLLLFALSLMLMSWGVAGGRGGSRGDGGSGDGGGGGVPTTLPSGQSPGPSRPGTKYPVRGQSLTSTTHD